jgi:hypothetical protein
MSKELSLNNIYSQIILKEDLFFNDGFYTGKEFDIPDDLAVWCMYYYSGKNDSLFDYKNIPIDMIKETKKMLKRFQALYQGFGSNDENLKVKIFNSESTSISWTISDETAYQFADKFAGSSDTMYGYVATLDINEIEKIKYIISMDLIFENLSHRQINMVKDNIVIKDVYSYASESEILIFDTIQIEEDNLNKIG